MMRTNRFNTGKPFESEIERVLIQYQSAGILRMKKVDPPLRYIGPGKVLHLANPFVDFVGCWTERGGRMIAMECKSTKRKPKPNRETFAEPRLPLGEVFAEPRLPLGDGGLTERQVDALRHWSAAGAVAFLLWRHGDADTALIPWPAIRAVVAAGQRRHLLWSDGVLVRRGLGFVTVDFVAEMRKVFPA